MSDFGFGAVSPNKRQKSSDNSADISESPIEMTAICSQSFNSFNTTSSYSAATGTTSDIEPSSDLCNPANPIVTSDLVKISVDAARRLSDSNKRWLLMNCYRPGSDVVFPTRIEYGKSRSFQYAWIRE